MFYDKYLDDYYLNELFSNYDIHYLRSMDQDNFESVYQVFKKYNFYFIEDIIEEYLEIFEMDKNVVEERILILKDRLGEDYVNKIGEDLSYLDRIINS